MKVRKFAHERKHKRSICEIYRRRLLEEETPKESNDIHHLSAARAGKSVREKSLPRRLLARGAGDESQFARGSSSGEFRL